MATRERLQRLTLENVQLRFKNFAGAAGAYNVEGDRNFCVFLDPDVATAMIEAGWNVKQLKPREEGDAPQDYIKVKVSYREGQAPPRITMIKSNGSVPLDKDTVKLLDWAQFSNADLIISPYAWTSKDGSRSGISAYLYSLYVTLIEDELALRVHGPLVAIVVDDNDLGEVRLVLANLSDSPVREVPLPLLRYYDCDQISASDSASSGTSAIFSRKAAILSSSVLR